MILTEVFPGTHKKLVKPKSKDDKSKKIIKILADPGSVIITHGALWHRAGKNLSKQNRLALLGSFAASYAREISDEEDQSRVIDNFTIKKASKFLKRIIGYNHGIKVGSQITLTKRK